MDGYFECAACFIWAALPAGFDERRHFGQCPDCGKALYLIAGGRPEEVGYREKDKRTVTAFINHRGR